MKRALSFIICLIILLSIFTIPITPTHSQNQVISITAAQLSFDIGENKLFSAQVYILVEQDELEAFTIEFPFLLTDVKTTINNSLSSNFVNTVSGNSIIEITPSFQYNSNDNLILDISAEVNFDIDEISQTERQFFIEWKMTPTASQTNVSVTLPVTAYVSTSQGQEDVFPVPSEYTTDGRRIQLNWYNLPAFSQNTRIFVKYIIIPSNSGSTVTENPQSQTNYWLALLFPVGILIGFAIYYLYRTRYPHLLSRWIDRNDWDKMNQKENESASIPNEDANNIKVIEKVIPVVLKSHEIDILRIIAEAGGSIYQSDLVQAVEVSKARVSQYLTEFEDRNLIKKDKMGRQNLIILKIASEDLEDF